nr:MAG: E2 protein [Neophocaena asiaeorientalis asiaeorientalis papillomavirus 3]
METQMRFCSRLDALQDGQMDLLELDNGDIDTVESYVHLVRKESMLMCAAHAKGIKKLGVTAVPPKAICEEKAKKAIELHLLVCSLKASSFGRERWLLSELSTEMYYTPPCRTFKKNGHTVRTTFGSDAANCMEYACWTCIYYQTDSGTWCKSSSNVDSQGIYTTMDGFKVYYVDFNKEAEKYASPGCKVRWEGMNLTGSALVSSTSCCIQPPVPAPAGSPEEETDGRPPKKRKRPADGPPRPAGFHLTPPSTPTSPCAPAGTGCADNYAARDTSKSLSVHITGNTTSDCQPDCGSSGGTGNHPLIPALLITGGANQVKCFRWRLKRHHRSDYNRCSTTWTWVSSNSLEREGGHRIFVSFFSSAQRKVFEDTVPLPSGVSSVRCELPY